MGTLNPSLLQGLVERLTLKLFPRVLADEGNEPDSLGPKPYPLPRSFGSPHPAESGWDRIRDLFDRDPMERYPEELLNIMKGAITGMIAGFLYGGVPAAQHARNRYIEQSQAEVFRHRIEAVRAAHNAALRGFIRYGWRWGWRVATFVTIFNTVNTGLSVYRDKNSLGHFAAAGVITGGLFRMNLGLRGLVGGSVIGVMLGVPVGVLMTGLQMAAGETLRERKRREQKELYELRLEEWAARMNVTETAFEDVSGTESIAYSKSDEQKINELLSLPRNPGSESQEKE